MARRYLVTGGAGYVGSHFVRYLLRDEPDARITNLDALTYAGVPATVAELGQVQRALSGLDLPAARR